MTNINGLIKQEQKQQETRAVAVAHRSPWSKAEVQALQDLLTTPTEGFPKYHLSSEDAVAFAKEHGRTYGAIIMKAHDLREELRAVDRVQPIEYVEEPV